jgi:hypothetical protein
LSYGSGKVIMAIGKLAQGGLAGVVLRWASRLRFPYLFALTAILFVLNLFIPDVIPLADELLMGLVAVLFASLRKKPAKEEPPPAIGKKS